jgi:hypothetical protein
MGHLTITFAGVCTHFTALQAIDPGLPPHRVVLPHIGDFRFGTCRTAWQTAQPSIDYYLQPHFATISTRAAGTPLLDAVTPTVGDFTLEGYFYSSALIEVANPSNTPGNALTRDDWFTDPTYSLSKYVSDYAMSEDVVISGRAMCYLDLRYGHLSSPKPGTDNAAYVVAEIDTDGAPVLTFTHMNGDGPGAALTLDEFAEVQVSNLEYDASSIDGDTPFDFIQHYVTAKRGMPPALLTQLPGMSPEIRQDPSMTAAIANALNSLASAIRTAGQVRPTPDSIRRLDGADLNPSCSDSHYP